MKEQKKEIIIISNFLIFDKFLLKTRFLKELIKNWAGTITREQNEIFIKKKELEILLEPFPSFDEE